MKAIMTSAFVWALAGSTVAACGNGDGQVSESKPNIGQSEALAARAPAQTEAQAEARTAFDEKFAAVGEAAAPQAVPPELAARLEADYQASLRQPDAEHTLAQVHLTQMAVDFEALFERIRTTMPPARGALLIEYVNAAQQVADPVRRTTLIERLSSQELNNVH